MHWTTDQCNWRWWTVHWYQWKWRYHGDNTSKHHLSEKTRSKIHPSSQSYMWLWVTWYFYGNYSEDEAEDINMSKHVMEVRWNANPNFTRAYAFLYWEEDTREPLCTQPLTLQEAAAGDYGNPWYHFAWQTGEVCYTVCVLQGNTTPLIIDTGEEDAWECCINDANRDCVSIENRKQHHTRGDNCCHCHRHCHGHHSYRLFTANLYVNIKGGKWEMRWKHTSKGGSLRHPQVRPQHRHWWPNHGTQVHRVGSQYGTLGSHCRCIVYIDAGWDPLPSSESHDTEMNRLDELITTQRHMLNAWSVLYLQDNAYSIFNLV